MNLHGEFMNETQRAMQFCVGAVVIKVMIDRKLPMIRRKERLISFQLSFGVDGPSHQSFTEWSASSIDFTG